MFGVKILGSKKKKGKENKLSIGERSNYHGLVLNPGYHGQEKQLFWLWLITLRSYTVVNNKIFSAFPCILNMLSFAYMQFIFPNNHFPTG